MDADRTALEQIEAAYPGMQCHITLGATQRCLECIVVSLSARNTTGEMVFDERLCNHRRDEQPRLCGNHSFGECYIGAECRYEHIDELKNGTPTMTALWSAFSDECLAYHHIVRPVVVVPRVQVVPTGDDFKEALVSQDDEMLAQMDSKQRKQYKKRIAKERKEAHDILIARQMEIVARTKQTVVDKVNPLDTFSLAGMTPQGLVDAGFMAELPANPQVWINKVKNATTNTTLSA